MRKQKILDQPEGLTRILDHICALAPQLPQGFGVHAHKIRIHCCALMGLSFSQQQIFQLATARYTFTKITSALKKSL